MSKATLKGRMLEAFRMRMYFFLTFVTAIICILLIQLINLQLLQGKEYKEKSRLNMENYVPISASRGEVYDRNYHPDKPWTILVTNRPSFNISVIPAKYKSKKHFKATLRNVCGLLDINYVETLKDIRSENPWTRVTIKEDVPFEKIIILASHQNKFPYITWEDAPVRVYNYNNIFAHSIGYIGSINKKEYQALRKQGYKHYQKLGKSGIEKTYDNNLRGKDGYVRRIVDVRNRTEGEEVGQVPIPGDNIILTLDYELQQVAFDATKGMRAAVIAIKPATGEILTLLSRPDFDPNLIISKENAKHVLAMSKDKKRPFLNRTIQAKYPPASTFKLVTAIAALETEKSHSGKVYYCPGKYTLKGYKDRDFYCNDFHRHNNLYDGIAKSCNVYFYNLGYKIGPTAILKYANYFGLNEKTRIDLPGEKAGFIPSKKWKLRTFGQSWFDGDTINLSIGQGFLAVTPLGMANLAAGIANNGIVYRPHLVKEIRTPDNEKLIRRVEKQKLREIPLSPTTLQTIRLGMRKSVQYGTNRRLSYLKVPIAGKTGTAQTRSKRLEKASQHAWFVGFAPFNGPPEKKVVIAVLVEYGVAGAVGAVPIAERLFAKMLELGYFK